MAFLHEEDAITIRSGQILVGTSKGTTGEFVIVAKFGGHVLRHLASRLVNVIRQGVRLKT